MGNASPYFCTYLFIIIYNDFPVESLSCDQIQGRTQISLLICLCFQKKKKERKRKKSSFCLPKRLLHSPLLLILLRCTLCTLIITGRYCNNTDTFHPPGNTEGNSSEEVIGREIQQLQVAFSTHVSVVNSTFIVLYYIVLHSSSYRSATAVSKEVTISLVHLHATKQ